MFRQHPYSVLWNCNIFHPFSFRRYYSFLACIWHSLRCVFLVLCHFMVHFVAGCITFNIGYLKWSPLKELLVTFLSKGDLLPAVFPGDQQSKHKIKINLDLHSSVPVN